jgi:hypothetical protein
MHRTGGPTVRWCALGRSMVSATGPVRVSMDPSATQRANALMDGCGLRRLAQLCVNATVTERATTPTRRARATSTLKGRTASDV